jgi:hypothetical protein
MTEGERIREDILSVIRKFLNERNDWVSGREIANATDLNYPIASNKGYITWSALAYLLDKKMVIDNGERGHNRKYKLP